MATAAVIQTSQNHISRDAELHLRALPRESDRSTHLRQLVSLLTTAADSIIADWERKPELKPPVAGVDGGIKLPSQEFYNAQRTIQAVTGSLIELISEPQSRLLEVSSQYFESRALHIAAEHRVADLLDGKEEGVPIEEVAERIGVEKKKLARIMRCLCSIHLFREPRPSCFANNAISQSLAHNEPLRAYIMMFSLDIYSASDYLPLALKHPLVGKSYDVDQTAFQMAVGTHLPRWSWLEEQIPKSLKRDHNSTGYPRQVGSTTLVNANSTSVAADFPFLGEHDNGRTVVFKGETEPRPEMELFQLAMVGGGRVFGTAHLYDFPWGDLGEATVVDVGSGIGGFALQLAQVYPNLRFVLQDRPTVIGQAKGVWEKQRPDMMEDGKITLLSHDFFEANPTQGADIYWLRYILHDWSDKYCTQILSSIASVMAPSSRILIADQIMSTTLGCPELAPAPKPLPANYGYHQRYSHQRDMCMMSIINGIERTPDELRTLADSAGLRVEKIWDARSQVGILELRLK